MATAQCPSGRMRLFAFCIKVEPNRGACGRVDAHSRRNEGSEMGQRHRFGGHAVAQRSIKKRMVSIRGGGWIVCEKDGASHHTYCDPFIILVGGPPLSDSPQLGLILMLGEQG